LNQLIASLISLKAPPHILAALEVLQFQNSTTNRLALLSDAERSQFLRWCDVRQLSLLLPNVAGATLPGWLHETVLQRAARYEVRFKRLKCQLFEIVQAFDAAQLEFVMLKGLSHAPALSPDARLRAQGDIDLWLPGPSVYEARDLLRSLGYVPLLNSGSRHLAPMARASGWEWQGDLFDPEMPVSIELHYELWSEQAEYIAVPALEQFWARKQLRDFDGYKIHVLCEEDLLAFASLHLLLHLLHGELPLQRAWEIARFLDTHVGDDSFWKSWRSSHAPALRQLETTAFCLVAKWFSCSSREELEADRQTLPAGVKLWLQKFALAPLTREWTPNKMETWLHLAFIRKRKDMARVVFRRLIPTALPLFAEGVAVPSSPLARLRKSCRQIRWLTPRLVHHLVTFFPTVLDGLRWFWLRNHEQTVGSSSGSRTDPSTRIAKTEQ
jgi:hypothetical protein